MNDPSRSVSVKSVANNIGTYVCTHNTFYKEGWFLLPYLYKMNRYYGSRQSNEKGPGIPANTELRRVIYVYQNFVRENVIDQYRRKRQAVFSNHEKILHKFYNYANLRQPKFGGGGWILARLRRPVMRRVHGRVRGGVRDEGQGLFILSTVGSRANSYSVVDKQTKAIRMSMCVCAQVIVLANPGGLFSCRKNVRKQFLPK